MAVQNLGIGWFFQGKDDGLDKTQKKAKSGFDSIKAAVGNLNSSFNALISDGGALTTSWEAMYVQNAKQTKAMAANYGMTGAAIQNFTDEAQKLAIKLNLPVEATAKAIQEYSVAEKELNAIGIHSKESLAKTAAVYGLNLEEQRTILLQLRNTFKFTDDNLKDVYGSVFSLGIATKDVRASLSGLPDVLENLRKEATINGILDPNRLADLTQQWAGLSQGMYKFEGDAGKAGKAALRIMNVLTSGQQNFAELSAGLQNDLAKVPEELAIITGSAPKAFEMMASGPEGFMKAMAQMYQSVKKNGGAATGLLTFMKVRLHSIFGDDTQAMTRFMESYDTSVGKTMDGVKKGTKDIEKETHKAFSTGYTIADLAKIEGDEFIKRVRSTTSAGADLVHDLHKQYKELGDSLIASAKNGNVFTKTLIEMNQIGLKALLPKNLRATATALGTIMEQAEPAMKALSQVGINFENLTSVTGIAKMALGGVITDFALRMVKNQGNISKSISDVGKDINDFMDKAGDWVKFAVEKIEEFWKEHGPSILDKIDKISKQIAPLIEKAMPYVRSAFEWIFTEAMKVITPVIQSAIPGIISAVIKGLWQGLRNALPNVTDLIPTRLLDLINSKNYSGEHSAYNPELKQKYEAAKFAADNPSIANPDIPRPAMPIVPVSKPIPFADPLMNELTDATKENGSTMIDLLKSIDDSLSRYGLTPAAYARGPQDPSIPTQNYTGSVNRTNTGR